MSDPPAFYRLIVNPIAGRGAGQRSLPLLRRLLAQHGLSYDLQLTERPWHAAELARQAAREGIPAVVAVGGDGTSNEVLNGLMLARQEQGENRSAPMLGILGVGRGNDFAYGMGFPSGLEAGVAGLQNCQPRRVDIGWVAGGDYPQGRYFGNGVGIGFDAVVGFVAARMTRLRGFLNYMLAALKTIYVYYRAPKVRIETDQAAFELSALMVSIMNGRRMGGGFYMAPHAQVDDGWLDFCIAEQVSKGRILSLIPHFMRGDQASQPSIQTGRTHTITVTALEGSLPAHADGETLCTQGESLTARLIPGAIEILSPSRRSVS